MSRREQWALIEGDEVEGRLRGVRSLFVQPIATYAMVEAALIARPDLQHVYLCWMSPMRSWSLAYLALRHRRLVTLAVPIGVVSEVPDEIMAACHVQAIVSAPGFGRLKAGDEVRLDDGPLHNYSLCVAAAMQARPEDYVSDREVVQ